MSKKWTVIYYEDETGFSEVYNFIENLDKRNQAKMMAWIDILSEKGPNLPRPYSDLLENGIHELRIKLSGNQVRVLYFFCFKDYIVLTNKFKKTTDKVPKNEILKSIKYKNLFLSKYNENNIMEAKLDENI